MFLHIGLLSRIPPYSFRWNIHHQDCLHPTIWKVWIYQSTFWTHTSTSILPRTHDGNIKRFRLCHCLFGWNHHLQQHSRKTPRPHKTSLWKVKNCSPVNETQQMSLYHEGNPVPMTYTQHQTLGHYHQNASNQKHASAKHTQTSTCISWIHGILQKIHQELCKNSQAFDTINPSASKIWVDISPSPCFLTLKESVIRAPILHYPNPKKCYIFYTDASDDACGAQLSQEHDGTESPW